MLPAAGQTAEASESSTKRNALTEIVKSRTENYFDVFSVEKLDNGTPRMSPALVLLFYDPVSTGRVYGGLLALVDWARCRGHWATNVIYIYIYIYMERLFLMFLDHTQRRSTVGRTPLDE